MALQYWESLTPRARESVAQNAAYVVEEYGYTDLETIHGILLTGG